MRYLPALFVILIALNWLGTAHALNPKEAFADTAMEARARDIGQGLRCMVCQNQSIFDSNAELAEDLRVLVRERMIAGDTDAQILAYIQDRYGDYVLLEPPVAEHIPVLWAVLIGFLVIGGMVAALYLHRRTVSTPKTPANAELTPQEREAVRQLLRGDPS